MKVHPWSGLIDTWFAGTLEDSTTIPQRMEWWFTADPKNDAALADRFSEVVEQCALGQLYRWLDDPEGRLAMILALDQLPRSLFRGKPRAFAYDSYTAALCLAAAQTGQDKLMKPIQRVFLYMPLQHFEDLQAQEAGVALYKALADEHPETPYFREGVLPFAKLHRDIISRFGRFPHRNKVLQRENTPEEAEYLASNAPTFGQ